MTSDRGPESFGLVVPVRNPGTRWNRWLELLMTQTCRPTRTVVIDSSDDDTAAVQASKYGAEVVRIPPERFDHGETRRQGALMLDDCSVIFMCTQDAYFADSRAIEHLSRAFVDDGIGAAFGRQLPRPHAHAIEAHARHFNYPDRPSTRGFSDAPRLGIKTGFLSDTFAAYRREALLAVGGFPHPLVFGEDAVVGARLILAGWKIAYVPEARVVHSHPLSVTDEFKRHFDIGVLHASHPWIQQSLGRAGGEGLRFLQSEVRYLRRHDIVRLPEAGLRTAAKLAGYRAGCAYRRIPNGICMRMSMNPRYWRTHGVPPVSSAPIPFG